MFNLGLNINKLIRENLPALLHTPIRLNRIKVYLAPLRLLWQEFNSFFTDVKYKAGFNGGMICLQAALNDKFDNSLRRITVVDTFPEPLYIFYTTENQPAPYLYWVWEVGINFSTGQYCYKDGIIYQANANTTGADVPGVSAKWDATNFELPSIGYTTEYTSEVTFFVNVPAAITFDVTEMKALINSFIFAGPGYLIKIV